VQKMGQFLLLEMRLRSGKTIQGKTPWLIMEQDICLYTPCDLAQTLT
jgi:hypothetical protein